jgi:AcrR family transcriptional regulator
LTTRERIIEAAARVMLTRGLAATTTKEIARAAGLSEAALYKHFRDKADLFLTVLHERLPPLVGLVHELPRRAGSGGTVEETLEEVARLAIALYGETIVMSASLFSEPDLLARFRETLLQRGGGPHRAIGLVAAYLRDEQNLGRVTANVSPRAAAALLLGSCFQRAFLRSFVGAEAVEGSDEEFVREVVGTLVRAL